MIGKEKPFLIMDSRCEMKGSQRNLHVLLLHFKSSPDDSVAVNNKNVKMITFIEWLSFSEGNYLVSSLWY